LKGDKVTAAAKSAQETIRYRKLGPEQGNQIRGIFAIRAVVKTAGFNLFKVVYPIRGGFNFLLHITYNYIYLQIAILRLQMLVVIFFLA
jgi:hypothetical protein